MATSALGGSGASNGESAPGVTIAIFRQAESSMVHERTSSRRWFPNRAKQPTVHSVSPMHLAAQVRPFRQSPSSAHAVVCSLHDVAKHCGSMSSGFNFPCAMVASSFSASAGAAAPTSNAALKSRGAAACASAGSQLLLLLLPLHPAPPRICTPAEWPSALLGPPPTESPDAGSSAAPNAAACNHCPTIANVAVVNELM